MTMIRFLLRWWTGFAAFAAVALLAAAHAFERFGGFAPCALCLKQRDVYWAVLAIAVPATLWTLVSRAKRTPRAAAFLLFALFTTEAIVAVFHAGGELDWWALPATCSGGGASIDTAAMQALLGGAAVSAPMCDVAAWTFAGVSMAGWNAAAASVLALFSLAASIRPRGERGMA